MSYRDEAAGGVPWRWASQSALIALRIVMRWPRRNPTRDELMEHFGMTRATAYRWINSLRTARAALEQDSIA